MSNRSAQVIGICEDAQQYTFLYRLLKRLGFTRHRIHIEKAPVGRGAADQWIRNRYPDEVETYRQESARMQFGLLTAIDADKHAVQVRHQQLDNELDASDLEKRRRNEQICVLVPKRNIETWIYALFGREVNEKDAYPKLEKESECQPAVKQLVEYLRHDVPDDLIPSLRRGCQELDDRLPE